MASQAFGSALRQGIYVLLHLHIPADVFRSLLCRTTIESVSSKSPSQSHHNTKSMRRTTYTLPAPSKTIHLCQKIYSCTIYRAPSSTPRLHGYPAFPKSSIQVSCVSRGPSTRDGEFISMKGLTGPRWGGSILL